MAFRRFTPIFSRFYANLNHFQVNIRCIALILRNFIGLFGAYFPVAKIALVLIFTLFSCLLKWNSTQVVVPAQGADTALLALSSLHKGRWELFNNW